MSAISSGTRTQRITAPGEKFTEKAAPEKGDEIPWLMDEMRRFFAVAAQSNFFSANEDAVRIIISVCVPILSYRDSVLESTLSV